MVSSGYLGDPEAAEAAAEAVRPPGRLTPTATRPGPTPGHDEVAGPAEPATSSSSGDVCPARTTTVTARPAAATERFGPPLAGADPDDLLDGEDPHLAVADLAGAGRVDDGVDHLVDLGVVDEDLEPDLRHELDLVLRTPVDLGVTTLAPEALGLREGHPWTPRALRASLTSSSLNGFSTATISFMLHFSLVS